ncbi:aminotransferase class III-fold pyridoxal phosphate-dependent enzyme [Frigidibacter albus]|uniref:Aminotransferase class III-fold pyridoxal phosphate-dependent enzyme n=1 Tax=Frigidibacter albus TaxID=1465486 RepID=A0A6L8VIN5_9RHOB|nr:aspartate aminotransferase family protein [Frigidibacter albus]MZQ90195.1 aminotransferase class III-fold pyridoxal phosphate-dependent enzyme [Frigidibacter albus]NBE32307.1 aminotransferase class III-fold pyridoxal phosphate-dependent enzyme [Frigidibacter albus]GGH58073.1 aspartate aminotransferase family protein [Frigidibacter albus]
MTETPAIRQILDMNAFDASAAAGAAPAVRRRLGNLGAASVLFYRDPIEMVSASGCWMTDVAGRRYLDFYNNVPSVGHSHPAVVRAVADQIARLNTNTRYVVAVVDDYLDALKARLPADLSNVVMTCSGSEANDLALRIARAVTGRQGFVVTTNAYHGNTDLVTGVSPSALKRGGLPAHVVAIAPPGAATDTEAGFLAALAAAMAELEARGFGMAAFLCDAIFSSDGIHDGPPGFLARAADLVRARGGLFIADEVQPGFGRTGAAFWGFARHGAAPDIVTMGKPMGNGFPMAAMATRPDHLAAFCADTGYFNTFGGNPVAAAAGAAVLRVIEDEGLQHNASVTGTHLLSGIRALAATRPHITAVRGAGLFIGVDIGREGAPDPGLTLRVIDAMRSRGVLIGAAGLHGATLKLRPPLCLTRDEADLFVTALDDAMGEVAQQA